jgi:acylphosphatase
MIARRLTISGRVQGVGFRYALADEARNRKLSGWVRNRRDGSVEALVVGPEADVEAIIAWAHRGPPAARVSAVAVAVEPATTDARGFEIITAV